MTNDNARALEKETERLKTVARYHIFDSESEEAYDNITFLASQVCQTPISTITFVDESRQWFKSKVGFEHQENPKQNSFCALAITKKEKIIVVPNLMENTEFAEIGRLNGLQKNGFYAGVTITDANGLVLGTLCVIDYESRNLQEEQIKSLEILADQVSNLLKQRLKNIELKQQNDLLVAKYQELEQFASTISHDLKTPVNNIISLVQLIKENMINISEQKETENLEYADYMVTSSYQLKNYIDDLLSYYKTDPAENNREIFRFSEVADEITQTLNPLKEYIFEYKIGVNEIFCRKIIWKQILINLISNGIKYNKKDTIVIKTDVKENDSFYFIAVQDNGVGIAEKNFKLIFSEFQTLAQKDRFGNYGKGLGLPKVKNLVEKLNGSIKIESTIDSGSKFTISIPK